MRATSDLDSSPPSAAHLEHAPSIGYWSRESGVVYGVARGIYRSQQELDSYGHWKAEVASTAG
jgi:hypothetical protein